MYHFLLMATLGLCGWSFRMWGFMWTLPPTLCFSLRLKGTFFCLLKCASHTGSVIELTCWQGCQKENNPGITGLIGTQHTEGCLTCIWWEVSTGYRVTKIRIVYKISTYLSFSAWIPAVVVNCGGPLVSFFLNLWMVLKDGFNSTEQLFPIFLFFFIIGY